MKSRSPVRDIRTVLVAGGAGFDERIATLGPWFQRGGGAVRRSTHISRVLAFSVGRGVSGA